ncbi:hypothetical protein ACNKHM_20175 [Shigella sonnei]
MIKSGRSPAAQRLLNTTAGMDPASGCSYSACPFVAGTGHHELFQAVETLPPYAPAAWRPVDDYQQRCCACRAGAGCLMVTQWQAGNAKEETCRNCAMHCRAVAISNPLNLRNSPAASIMSKRWTLLPARL